MQKILVPLDGSAFAEQAVETARSLAHRARATVEFVGVTAPAHATARMGSAPPVDRRYDVEQREALRDYLTRVEWAEHGRSMLDVSVVLREGAVADAIVTQAVDGQSDFIVMTTHGRGGFDRLWLGSTADRVIRASPVPVLLIRPGESPLAGAVTFRRVVVGVAGEDADDRVVSAAAGLIGLADVHYLLVHVLPVSPVPLAVDANLGPPPDEMAGLPAAIDTEHSHSAVRYLEWMAGPLRARGAHVDTKVVTRGSPARALSQLAADFDADLIVVGTAARTPIARLFLGSTADKVVRTAPCHVLVCPPPFGSPEELRL